MAASFPGAIKSFSAVVNGVTKLVAALFNSGYDEITAIETALGANMANVRFGAQVDKTADYAAQQADTDGFVTVVGTTAGSAASYIEGFTDGSNPPTTRLQYVYIPATTTGTHYLSFIMPVKKNDYWYITFLGGCSATKVVWIPSGG
jgi:hypothetical protein